MKIFIGGAKDPSKFIRRWPQQEFEFAAEDESPAVWVRKARKCEHHVVYQHRTTHAHTVALAQQNIKPLFTDSTPIMLKVVESILNGYPKKDIHELLAMYQPN